MSTPSQNSSVPRRRTALVVTSIVAVVAIVVAAFVLLRGDGAGDGSAAGPGGSRTSPTQTTSIPPTTTMSPSESATSATPSGSSTTASALPQLEPFFRAASRMDARLRVAAAKINEAEPPWYSLSEDVSQAVRHASLDEVAETLPGGLSEPLLLSTMAVYHDLAARRRLLTGGVPVTPHSTDVPSLQSAR